MTYLLLSLPVLALLSFLLARWAGRKARREHAAYLVDREERRGDHGFHPDVEQLAIKQRRTRALRRPWR